MKVIILCGGLGMRIREEAENRPKPMVKIGEKPILWHIMKIYAHYGYNDFVLCLGYKGELIKEYFYNYEFLNNDFTIELGSQKIKAIRHGASEKGWRVTLSDTGETAFKGARIKKIEKYVDTELFMVTYGDGVANINLDELVKFHKAHGKIGTLTGVRPPSRFGELIVDRKKVVSFVEKPQVSQGLINGGFFVFNRKFFDYLSEKDNCDLEMGPLEQLAKKGQLMVFEHRGEWECMDNYRDMVYLNKLWQTHKAFWKTWHD